MSGKMKFFYLFLPKLSGNIFKSAERMTNPPPFLSALPVVVSDHINIPLVVPVVPLYCSCGARKVELKPKILLLVPDITKVSSLK